MSTSDKDCKITLYLDTPGMLLRPDISGKSRPLTWFSGHAFIGLTNKAGKERCFSFEPDNSHTGSLQCLTGCRGHFAEEYGNPYTEAIVYPISQKSYDAALKRAEEMKRADMTYKLFSKNCSTVAASLLEAAGVARPSRLMRLSPHGLVLKKRAMLMRMRMSMVLQAAKSRIAGIFREKSVPPMKLLNALKDKPLPVPIREARKTSRLQKKLEDSKIMRALLPKICREN
ncbi:MAG: DUF4105 domain-containing protein [Alphaproteobacteria bacterium]